MEHFLFWLIYTNKNMVETKAERSARMKKMGLELGRLRKKVAAEHPGWEYKHIMKSAGALYKKKHPKKHSKK